MSLHLLSTAALARSTSRVVKRADCEHLLAAQEVLVAARQAAADQQRQMQAARQEAMRDGRAAGIETGQQAWARHLAQRHLARQAQLNGLQHVLVQVVMSSLRHLLGQLPDEDKFMRLTQRALQSVVRARQLRLVVAEPDALAARAALQRWQGEHPEAAAMDVVIDAALTPGDCVVETDEGAVDGRLEQRLAALEDVLLQRLGQSVASSNAVPAEGAK